jgi:hypothetical protein
MRGTATAVGGLKECGGRRVSGGGCEGSGGGVERQSSSGRCPAVQARARGAALLCRLRYTKAVRGYHGLRHRHGRPGASNSNYYSRNAKCSGGGCRVGEASKAAWCQGPFVCVPERGAAQQTAVRFQDGPRGDGRLVSWDAGRAGERPTQAHNEISCAYPTVWKDARVKFGLAMRLHHRQVIYEICLHKTIYRVDNDQR